VGRATLSQLLLLPFRFAAGFAFKWSAIGLLCLAPPSFMLTTAHAYFAFLLLKEAAVFHFFLFYPLFLTPI